MISVEFYHVTDSNISISNQLDKISSLATNSTICCMIDDYNFSHTINIIPNHIKKITSVISFESSFADQASILIDSIKTYKINNIIYLDDSKIILKNNEKWSCSYLTALWYAARLGYIDYPPNTIFKSKPEASTKLINILDLKFKPSEKKAFKILKKLFPRINVKEQIDNHYYENI